MRRSSFRFPLVLPDTGPDDAFGYSISEITDVCGPQEEGGVLTAGRYRLFARVNTSASDALAGFQTAALSFELRVVPEPGTAALVGTMLAGLAARRRVRRASASR